MYRFPDAVLLHPVLKVEGLAIRKVPAAGIRPDGNIGSADDRRRKRPLVPERVQPMTNPLRRFRLASRVFSGGPRGAGPGLAGHAEGIGTLAANVTGMTDQGREMSAEDWRQQRQTTTDDAGGQLKESRRRQSDAINRSPHGRPRT
jgi:hypothetical protein